MKLNLERENLLKPLQMAIGVVERKQTLPILSNVLLNIEDSKISVTGTDLEVELIGQARFINSLKENTKLTLPGRKLMDICRALPEGAPIELYQDKGRMVLRSGKSRFTLTTLPANEFPNVEAQESHLEFKLEQRELAYLLHSCSFAMAQQDVRYYLNGILLEVNPSKITAVATDGHRLAMATIEADIDVEKNTQIIIPRKGVLELQRLLSTPEEKIKVHISNSYIRVSSNEYTFTSKLIDGKFPDYERVIPDKTDKTVSIEKEILKKALSRAAILCNEKFRGLRFEFRENLLRILANNPEQEVAEEELIIDYHSEHLDIGLNVTYFIDVLNAIQSESVQLHFSDSNSSLLIEEQTDQGVCVYVIMPMRL
ncbi:MAG: DNA polymerase III subunit beta [Gammaproteobacteria bacterium]|nr:DNA polymerase III subunit beta [Gammaproteobacteria bacterium]MCH9743697.1 DNA polymerase III subunit beta [Gammaproteobacteria bacterium]